MVNVDRFSGHTGGEPEGECPGSGKPIQRVDHPAHYGGAENPHEPIKVIEHYGLGFHIGNAIKYILRAPNKGAHLEDLKKSRWYLDREIARLEREGR